MRGEHVSKPFLDRYAKPADANSENPDRFYDPIAEVLREQDGSAVSQFERTGSEITKVTTDPTSDEATDR